MNRERPGAGVCQKPDHLSKNLQNYFVIASLIFFIFFEGACLWSLTSYLHDNNLTLVFSEFFMPSLSDTRMQGMPHWKDVFEAWVAFLDFQNGAL